ncbi:DUF2017 domain-containing protein [Marinitenerispora sediminis]|uniref:DUF2017 domain-containing protein n=1 Tax=Marinitenerispora sediminis TaxID=1931232 RepID=A0A368T055_9ACTN|nr:DUF2017 domain-containing protein [Marinitenerispora sediminis]RCV49947.1 DUF2017 domain-containing protein [Marinitenerispora sediminis]RCV51058.1 DUF2017 domain-containing protein [Marinitenerispora sediminis]RCV52349.1 DUF2017 domain-containing protein [Marinitenerispora sediminis]
MTSGFRSAPHGGVSIDLDRDETAVLRSMANLVLELVEPPPPQDEFAEMVGIGSSSEKPTDPVLVRLFPDAYSGDAESAGDFRRYTEDGLRRHKRENANAMLAALPEAAGRVVLGPVEAHAWMKSLNDIRLALGTRLGVEEESYQAHLRGERRADGDDAANTAAMHIYDWLGGLQETLVHALMR